MTHTISELQTIQKISEQLKAYGLNPLHWVAKHGQPMNEILWQHRTERDLTIRGRLLGLRLTDLEFQFSDENSQVLA